MITFNYQLKGEKEEVNAKHYAYSTISNIRMYDDVMIYKNIKYCIIITIVVV